jgi:hypothetical protein
MHGSSDDRLAEEYRRIQLVLKRANSNLKITGQMQMHDRCKDRREAAYFADVENAHPYR